MPVKPRIAITSGEPAGIGPDLCALLTQYQFDAEITLIGDSQLLESRGLKPNIHAASGAHYTTESSAFRLFHIPTGASVVAGRLDKSNSSYVLETLRAAVQGCQNGLYDAMVTAPVHKGVINDAGFAFSGHTEYLAELTHTQHVIMLLVGAGMRVALVTRHLPLSLVPKAITEDAITRTVEILHADLQAKFGIADPTIYVAGLNPHAGEGGYLGDEELKVISPTLDKLRAKGMRLLGPLSADTMFSPQNIANADAFLAMYHDQGLTVLKHASFGGGVNITLGLPIIRTSVDHGTALSLAGTGKSDVGSLKAAVELAINIAHKKRS